MKYKIKIYDLKTNAFIRELTRRNEFAGNSLESIEAELQEIARDSKYRIVLYVGDVEKSCISPFGIEDLTLI